MTIEPHDIHTMEVCPDCQDVVGYFYRLNGSSAGQGPLVQRGTCPAHKPRPYEPSWLRFDFNRQVDLCRCCGTIPLTSGSKWSVWFCDECKEQVGLLNGRHGRCIVPIGRHSVHYGWLIRGDQVDDPVVMQRFSSASKAAGVVIGALSDWHHFVVGQNLDAIGAAETGPTPIQEYCREVRERVDPMDRFRAMCEYLDRRGRAMLDARRGAGQ